MSKHQIIYTSCMRGMDGNNDGQQVFSYDASFRDSITLDVKSLLTYQVPSLDPGVLMDEEIALTMPKSYSFRRLDNGNCAVTLNTYLGRDYMGSAGRFGNHLSHSIICDENDFTVYPCELYGSDCLRDKMKYAEVNNPKTPDYLPEPELKKGYTVDIDSVIVFLSIGNRIDIFKNMFHALLLFESERKRLIICDERENIIFWIAALEYALPINMALKINFTTYEFDPALSTSQICGVIPNGTKFSPERAENANQYFIFDILRNQTIDFKLKSEFYDLLEMAMSFSYDSIKDFHNFINSSTSLETANLDYYGAFGFYELKSDGLTDNVPEQKFELTTNFIKTYIKTSEKINFVNLILSNKEQIVSFSNSYLLKIIKFIVEITNEASEETRRNIKDFIIESIFSALADNKISETDFKEFYNAVYKVCAEKDIIIPVELMSEANKDKLLSVLNNDIVRWKYVFILSIICNYVIKLRLPSFMLDIEHPIGKILLGFIDSSYKTSPQSGYDVTKIILDIFSDNYDYLVNMTLNIESLFYEKPNVEVITHEIWKYFYGIMAQKQLENRNQVFSILLEIEYFEKAFGLYEYLLKTGSSNEIKENLFKQHYKMVIRNAKYADSYLPKVLEAFYANYKNSDSPVILKDLLNIIIKNKVDVSFTEPLIEKTLINIPFGRANKVDEELIFTLYEYEYNVYKKLSGRLLLLFAGMLLEGIDSPRNVKKVLSHINRVTEIKINLTNLISNDAERYLDWINPSITQHVDTSEDLAEIYYLFNMTKSQSNRFIEDCAKAFLKRGKSEKDYSIYCEFLSFLFQVGDINQRELVGKVLCKLSKQNLEIMSNSVVDYFKGDRRSINNWKMMKEVAESTNPLLNNISNFFKRKKDE